MTLSRITSSETYFYTCWPVLDQMPVELPTNWPNIAHAITKNITTFDMNSFRDGKKGGNDGKKGKKSVKVSDAQDRGSGLDPNLERFRFPGGSRSVPISREVIEQLRNFLLSLPNASERGLNQ